MLSRPSLNSADLQQRFPAIYRDFFGRCQRVASASNSFLWTGEFAGFYGGLTISQKLPIRSYVGFETTFDKRVHVNRETLAYQADEDQFAPGLLDDRLHDNIQQYLESTLAKQSGFTGVSVHLLTEVPLGHSLGSNGAIAAGLALLLSPASASFNSRLVTARAILSLSQAGYSSGVSAYMALVDCQGPVVFFSEHGDYFAKPLHRLATLPDHLVWPIDFGLIYSGGGANAESVILANDQTVTELEGATKKLDQLLHGKQRLNFKKTYIEMLNMTSSLVVMALVDLFKRGAKNSRLEQLFNSLNQYQNLLHILHVSSGTTDLLYSRIHQLANKQMNDVGSGVKISGIGRGGAVLFAMPYSVHRKAIVEMVAELRQETGRPVWLDYASWLDGIGGQPGRIDQDITAGQSSIFIAHDTLCLSILQQGQKRREIITQERFAEAALQFDIILDQTRNKILIAGQALTSKELPSQKATVVILADLLKTSTLRLKNNELPGSYGSNRYDLQGKIVIPLIKQVKVRTGRDLQLTIRGGMFDDYQVGLEPSNITIALIEKKN